MDLHSYPYASPIVVTLLLWWISTGVILLLNGLPRSTYRWSFLATSSLATAALILLEQSTETLSIGAVYLSFFCGVLVWAWNEMAFLFGYLTGPRQKACAEDCDGWIHAWHALQAILYHELALAISAFVLIGLSWNSQNQVGMWAFLLLWGMRISSKLNVFLGVRNLSEEFLPDHLQYMRSFFRQRPMNLLFPVSVTIATALTYALIAEAFNPGATPVDVTKAMLLATLSALGVLEHWFMVVPVPATELWRWGMQTRRSSNQLGE